MISKFLPQLRTNCGALLPPAIEICSLLDRLANGDITLTTDTEDSENGIYTIEQFLHIIHNDLYCGLGLVPPPPLEEVDCMYALDI